MAYLSDRPRPATSRIIARNGADWINPPAPLTQWQRDRATPTLLPMANEFTGRQRIASWAALLTVALIFWTAFFCWILA
ncbi:hypothetical protein [Sphingomonas sp.]|uniref:hypothetical protein n=1 Tax=Sphingomonas sp. TaxID=28214 RepID=UPI00257A49A1|nr:hypothetical protein [Sphingomonas sp.]